MNNPRCRERAATELGNGHGSDRTGQQAELGPPRQGRSAGQDVKPACLDPIEDGRTPAGKEVDVDGERSRNARDQGSTHVQEIARTHEAQGERVEHLLTHYLSYFDYDAERAGDFVRDFGRKVEQGDIRLSDYIPALALAATPEAEDEALLCSLRDEGPSLLPALARFLADRPATADRTTPRPGA